MRILPVAAGIAAFSVLTVGMGCVMNGGGGGGGGNATPQPTFTAIPLTTPTPDPLAPTPTGLPTATPTPGMANANVRVIHASPDTPAVDVCVDGTVPADFAGLSFFGASNYLSVMPGMYNVNVIVSGEDCAVAGPIEATLDFASGTDTTVVAVGFLMPPMGNPNTINALVLTDDNTVDAANARVRFVHASPDAPDVDIRADGVGTLFNNVAYGTAAAEGYLAVPPGSYDLDVTTADGATTVLEVNGVNLQAGRTYTIFATGLVDDMSLAAQVVIDN